MTDGIDDLKSELDRILAILHNDDSQDSDIILLWAEEDLQHHLGNYRSLLEGIEKLCLNLR